MYVEVPGQVAGLIYVFEKYGSGNLTLEEVMTPAINLAQNGYYVTPSLLKDMLSVEEMMQKYPELKKLILNKDGSYYKVGDLYKSEKLAQTLKLIAKNGKDAFYTGDIAKSIVDSAKKYGGIITLEDLKNYNCSNIDYRPRVINYLDDIFNFISKLIEKDYAYVVDGDVYFRVSKIKDYGILSNQSIEELISGSRVDIDEKKENPLDFALWRKTTEGETFTSPWGEGIPGWHTECVVMINKLFGDKIDIHAGGVDLKFPHHENEIAQSIALNNNYIANYWMHNGHININNVKMSKSLNNFILAKDFIKEHSANVIKLAFLSTNYRQPLNLTDKVFDEALIIDNKIKTVLKSANNELNIKNIHNIKEEKDSTFEEYMNDDFNTPNVITLLLSLVKDLNQEIRNKGNNILTLTNKILTITNILGLSYSMPKFTEKQKETYNNWIKAREDKDFALADTLREKLVKENIL